MVDYYDLLQIGPRGVRALERFCHEVLNYPDAVFETATRQRTSRLRGLLRPRKAMVTFSLVNPDPAAPAQRRIYLRERAEIEAWLDQYAEGWRPRTRVPKRRSTTRR
jgi:hypothetical protein